MSSHVHTPSGSPRSAGRLLVAFLGLAIVAWAGAAGSAERQSSSDEQEWRQWGGPHRNFMSDSIGLADAWPDGGPPRLWSRPMGEGHSTIIVDEGRLFTMYRSRDGVPRGQWAEEEVVIALDAATGDTIWEHTYPSDVMNFRNGAGPHATPLVVGDRLFVTGTNKQFFAFDKRTGAILWSHDLVKDFDAPPTLIRPPVKAGYTCSPLAYGDTVIVTAGGPGQAVMAFNQSDGSVVWKSQDFLIAPASPILINVDGQEQLVVFGGQTINGLDPSTGELLWRHEHDTGGDMNNSTPIWGEDNILIVSSAYGRGTRAIRLTRAGGRTTVDELWYSQRLRVMFSSMIRVGDYVYGSSGDFGPAFLMALDAKTGATVWQERGFGKSSFLYADGKAIILDEDGPLILARVSPDGLDVRSRVQLFATTSWTAPTLVGPTLYVRDREQIMALDLGQD